jgi:hypothetical protein
MVLETKIDAVSSQANSCYIFPGVEQGISMSLPNDGCFA